MLMEQNVLRSNWLISDQEYPVGIHSSMEQQHFPTLMPFSSYSAFPPPPTRFKEASPRTFGSLYPPSSTQSSHLSLHSLPLSLSIPRPSGSRKASEEERKAKHREAQRRFVKRKKAEMVQLKQLAVELELQYQLLEITSERMALEKESQALENDIALARENANQSEQGKTVKVHAVQR